MDDEDSDEYFEEGGGGGDLNQGSYKLEELQRLAGLLVERQKEAGREGPRQNSASSQERVVDLEGDAEGAAPASALWQDIISPREAGMICGNPKAIKFFTMWLEQWKKKYNPPKTQVGCRLFKHVLINISGKSKKTKARSQFA
jgi:hypothetical protein